MTGGSGPNAFKGFEGRVIAADVRRHMDQLTWQQFKSTGNDPAVYGGDRFKLSQEGRFCHYLRRQQDRCGAGPILAMARRLAIPAQVR